jgi:DNA repair exonuclease SbcCD ATPase subunit
MLDTWRGTLAQRLQEVIKLPDVPPEAGQAFAEVWRLALSYAETFARTTLAEEQNVLFAAQTDLTQERKLWEIALAEAQASVAEQVAKLALAEVQLNDRQTLVDQLEAQRIDLLQQRDRLHAQVEQYRTDLETLRAEYATSQAHVRAVEDRAHRVVDQARLEVKALQQRLEQDQREHSNAVAQLTTKQEDLRDALRSAEQATAHQAGRVAALEATLSQWRNTLATSKRKASPTPTKARASREAKRGGQRSKKL